MAMRRSETPLPYPLPMPAYGGYFAPLTDYLPENLHPTPGFHRSNMAVMILTYLVLDVDKDHYLLDGYKAGSVLSYMSMLFNIVVFGILFRQSLLSPATIFMQGLAAADFLTAFSSYGFEPIFQSQYHCENEIEFPSCRLPYPYCSLASHLSILSFTFHNVSYMITTCIGIQKVIAIIFPIWTRNAADFLTAFSSYGFEPIFQSQYHCENEIEFPSCRLPYPYCSLASHLSILSFTFHNVSYMITTCIGIQKVIAIIFPIWTRNQLTNKKALIVCVLCFILCITISIPRHFSYLNNKGNQPGYQLIPVCVFVSEGEGVSEYSSLNYLMIQPIS
ncbi:unnamed protein product [Mytilus coruscus]|uniref:G-protein coupled receptors family 1 profile domain-containing protein n=1 Tax=Mytilus coruscus TaxID=42192 RepID=A0A6J7ZWF4_MYTCO|nr:unnamed protein product [Mytilus coruscus]